MQNFLFCSRFKIVSLFLEFFPCSFETASVGKSEQYTYKFRVCREVFGEIPNSGLVQINKQTTKKIVVGRINETHLASGSKTT